MGALVVVALIATTPAAADRDASRAHFERGTAAYNLGDFETAAKAYEAAYAAEPIPQLLFNAGQAHNEAGQIERALFFYERYLRELPDAPNRVLVQERIAEAKERGEKQREQARLDADQEQARLALLQAEQERQRAEENRLRAEEERKRAEVVSRAAQAERPKRNVLIPAVGAVGAVAVGIAVASALAAGTAATFWIVRTRDTLPAADLSP